jgi:hypothetical protein
VPGHQPSGLQTAACAAAEHEQHPFGSASAVLSCSSLPKTCRRRLAIRKHGIDSLVTRRRPAQGLHLSDKPTKATLVHATAPPAKAPSNPSQDQGRFGEGCPDALVDCFLRVVIASGRIILDELHLHLCSDATKLAAVASIHVLFLQPSLVSSWLACFSPSNARLYKVVPSRQSTSSRTHAVANDEAAPVLSVHRTLLGGELAQRYESCCGPYPNAHLCINLERTRARAGGGWRRVGPFGGCC